MTAEAIATGVVAGILVLVLAWLAPRLRRVAWSWTTNLVAKAWRKVLTAAVTPLLTDLKGDVGEMNQAIKRIDSVLADLQLRVHDQLGRRPRPTANSADDTAGPESQLEGQATPERPEHEEADSGAD